MTRGVSVADPTHARVRAALARSGEAGTTSPECADAAGCHKTTARGWLQRLVMSGEATTDGRRYYLARGERGAVARSEVVLWEICTLTHDHDDDRRHECSRYGACHSAYLRVNRHGGDAHVRCPPGCSRYEERNRKADLAAMGRGDSPLAAATDYAPGGLGR